MLILGQIWNFFSSVKLAIFTLCTLAATSIIGTLVPQGESTSFYINNFGPKTAQFFKILRRLQRRITADPGAKTRIQQHQRQHGQANQATGRPVVKAIYRG